MFKLLLPPTFMCVEKQCSCDLFYAATPLLLRHCSAAAALVNSLLLLQPLVKSPLLLSWTHCCSSLLLLLQKAAAARGWRGCRSPLLFVMMLLNPFIACSSSVLAATYASMQLWRWFLLLTLVKSLLLLRPLVNLMLLLPPQSFAHLSKHDKRRVRWQRPLLCYAMIYYLLIAKWDNQILQPICF